MEAVLPDQNRRIDWTRINGRSSRVTVTEDVEVHPAMNYQCPQLGMANCLAPMSVQMAGELQTWPNDLISVGALGDSLWDRAATVPYGGVFSGLFGRMFG